MWAGLREALPAGQIANSLAKLVRFPYFRQRWCVLTINPERMEVSPVQLLIFQPSPFCNLNCTYCYLPDRQDKRVMDVEIVRTTVRRLREEKLLEPAVSIIWHAGEPTVVRRERYAEYFAAINVRITGAGQHQNRLSKRSAAF